jgi:hypothetical protein
VSCEAWEWERSAQTADVPCDEYVTEGQNFGGIKR